MGVPGPSSPAALPDAWTGLLGQELPLHLELPDLLVQPCDKGGVVLGIRFLTAAEDAGGSFGEGSIPSLYLARVDFIQGGKLGYRLLRPSSPLGLPLRRQRATLPLKPELCFLRRFDISQFIPTATAALSLRAGLSVS